MPSSHKKTVFIDVIGCEKRKLDGQRLLSYFNQNHYHTTTAINAAEVCVLVTCGFRESYQDISLKKFQKIIRYANDHARLIVAGCYGIIAPEKFREIMTASHRNPTDLIFLSPTNLAQIDTILGEHCQISFNTIPDPNLTVFDQKKTRHSEFYSSPAHLEYQRAKQHYKLRINEGCLGHCSYCVVRLATGPLVSKSLTQIRTEFEQGLLQGYKIFFLTGGDTGAYGQDLRENINIVTLLSQLFQYSDQFTLYFHDFGIQWLIRYQTDLISLLKANSSRLGCINLPIQSGSDRILHLMNREYSHAEVVKVLTQVKREIPSLKIGTHVIVGFPGETEIDFQQTVALIREVSFDFIIPFQYTDDQNAPSYLLPNKIDICIKKERFTHILTEFHINTSNRLNEGGGATEK